MDRLLQDLRHGLRSLVKSPGFTAVAVLSLGLGIGANTAIFTLLDQVILRLLPVKNPEELVLLASRGSHYGNNRGGNALSYPMYADFRDRAEVFGGLLCRFGTAMSMSSGGQTERVSGELVSGNYFQVLGVGAAIGRTFTPDDDRTPGGHPLAMLSYDFWRSRFASDPSIVGREILVNNRSMTIIGVSEKGFDGTETGYSPQIRVPVMMKAEMTPGWDDLKNRRSRWINVFGRLKPGMTAEQAKAQLQPFYHQLLEMEVREKEFNTASPYTKEQFLKSTIDVLPGSKGRSQLRSQFSTPLRVMMGIVGAVLLIACANVANLLIARAVARQKEFAVRLALGASRGRIVTQLLVESMLLALAGGALGIALAAWLDRLLLGFLPPGDSSLTLSSAPDGRILGFTLAVSLVTAVVFGLVPAMQSSRPDLVGSLKDQAGSVVGGGSQVRVRKALVVAQVTLSLLLLIASGLFIRSLRNLKTLDPGFSAQNLVMFAVDPSLSGYKNEATALFYRELADNLRALAGVRSVGLGLVPILAGDEWDSTITVEGYQAKPGEDMNPYFNAVSPDYFKTLGIPFLAGRDFNAGDNPTTANKKNNWGLAFTPNVAVVNDKLARHYFGDRNPIGKHIAFGGDPGTRTDIEIVGVIRDSKYTAMRDEVPRQVFVPHLQFPFSSEMTIYVRAAIPSGQLFSSLRGEVRKLDAHLPIYGMRTIETQLDRSLVTERMIANLSSVFGLLATLLAAIGLYGVMAYTVARRTREIGIRIALGAESGSVLWLVMREVVALVAVGVALGLPAAWALGRFVSTQLYDVRPSDPATVVAATAALALIAAFAGFLPARRATRVDPVEALRYE